MLVLIYGSQIEKVREVSRLRLEGLRKKRPESSFFRVDDETFDEARFEELIFGQGLFDKKFIVHLDRVLENKEAREYILKHLKELADSENGFIVTEYKLAKPTFDKIKKVAIKAEIFDIKKVETKQEFNIFSLSDALGKKDKKNLWVLYIQALKNNLVPEQIHGTFFTQIKNMLLIQKAKEQGLSATVLGLHPFVVKKTEGNVKNFTIKELEKHSRDLLHVYHKARGGGDELDVALEKFILSL